MLPKSSKHANNFVSLVVIAWATLFCSPAIGLAQSEYSLRSPDQRIEVKIHARDRLTYDVLLKGVPILQNSTLSMKIGGITIGVQPKVRRARPSTVNQEIVSAVPQKSVRLREN